MASALIFNWQKCFFKWQKKEQYFCNFPQLKEKKRQEKNRTYGVFNNAFYWPLYTDLESLKTIIKSPTCTTFTLIYTHKNTNANHQHTLSWHFSCCGFLSVCAPCIVLDYLFLFSMNSIAINSYPTNTKLSLRCYVCGFFFLYLLLFWHYSFIISLLIFSFLFSLILNRRRRHRSRSF